MSRLILLLVITGLFSCSSTSDSKTVTPIASEPENSKDTNRFLSEPEQPERPEQPAKTSKTSVRLVKPIAIDWQEGSEEDQKIEIDINAAILGCSLMIKRGLFYSLRHGEPVGLLLAKKSKDGADKVTLCKIASAPGVQPVKIREVIEEFTLPEKVAFEQEKYLWYLNENIEFEGEDKSLNNTFAPQGDIVIVPKNSNNPRRGYIDVIKQRSQIQNNQFIIRKYTK